MTQIQFEENICTPDTILIRYCLLVKTATSKDECDKYLKKVMKCAIFTKQQKHALVVMI